jgi:putative DNA methylase
MNAFHSSSTHEPAFECNEGTSLLDQGDLPVETLAVLALREGRRPRPVYQVHRWFARRFGSAFRALLTAARLQPEEDFWQAYYHSVDWSGQHVLDPFVGGGTSVVEALRLGATVTGIDIDTVACAVTRLETQLESLPDLRPALAHLKAQVGARLAPYYQTVLESGETRDVLHYFWVQVVSCRQCGHSFEAHPHYQLGYEAEGIFQWAFCPQCHTIKTLPRTEEILICERCNLKTFIHQGPVQYGRVTCPHCQERERLINVAGRTQSPPEFRLFALEYLDPVDRTNRAVPMKHRHFRSASAYDHQVLQSVEAVLAARTTEDGVLSWIPDRCIPTEDRSDHRLLSYGYTFYRELFNARQLLHLSYTAEAISQSDGAEREALAIAFSDHLTTNCMLTHYAFGWRRLSPLFSVRAYNHVTRPVEIHPWMDGTGRGTFPNAVRQIQQAKAWLRQPKEALADGGFCSTPKLSGKTSDLSEAQARIIHANSQSLDMLRDREYDLVLTDPPYFDNIAYSELSDFFLPWLQLLGIIPADSASEVGLSQNLAARKRDADAMTQFQEALGKSFREIARVLKLEGRCVFTYQHKTALAWFALASAVASANLYPIQVFPLLGDGSTGLHKHEGNSTWDAVFVLRTCEDADRPAALTLALSPQELASARSHYLAWAQRLSKQAVSAFREADQRNFYRACLVAGALRTLRSEYDTRTGKSLHDLLEEDLPRLEGEDHALPE